MKRLVLIAAGILFLSGCEVEDTPEVAKIRAACAEGNLTACNWIDIRDRELAAQRNAAIESFGDSMQQIGDNMQSSHSPINTTCYSSGYYTNCTSY